MKDEEKYTLEGKANDFLREHRDKFETWDKIEAMALFAEHYHKEQMNKQIGEVTDKWEKYSDEISNEKDNKVVAMVITATVNFILSDLKQLTV